MLDGSSPWSLHFAQNAALIILSLFLLPFDSFILFASYALQSLLGLQDGTKKRVRRSPAFGSQTILVTGVGMTKGLMLARTFYKAGHHVIGADFELYGVPVCGRFSKALRKFYALPKPNETDGSTYYIQDLLKVIQREKVDMWVSCSGVASAVEDGQAKEILERHSDCKCIQFDVPTTQTLHEKHSFIERASQLGLPTPETHNVTSRGAIHKVLHGSPKTKKSYIMKSVGMDDANRGDMTILPRRTVSETYQHIASIPISDNKPWVLQQYIRGKEYCTHALVINGEVKAFVACPSLELLMHYEALPSDSALSRAMLRFTQEFASRSGGGMTGHLSFDFLIEESVSERGAGMALLPIECNPRAHTAVTLFTGQEQEMANAYLSVLNTKLNGHTNGDGQDVAVVFPKDAAKYYWVGNDLVTLVLHPLLQVLLYKMSLVECLLGARTFLEHLLFWKDGTYEVWDPLPWWWLYHIYWPGQFLACILQRRKWSRINVSTIKMFGC